VKEGVEKLSRVDKTGEEQLDILGLRPEKMHGRILELGSGMTEKLKDTPGLPDDCEIISLGRHIFRGFHPSITALKEKSTWDRKTTEADALALPFEDASFDRILSVDAIPLFLLSIEDIRTAFKEVWRVLKPGGEARFFTANVWDLIDCRQLFSPLGAEVRLERLGPELAERYRGRGHITAKSQRLILKKLPSAR
jgi:SAM-dependent methyltransferase